MRSSTYIALLASAVHAQNTASAGAVETATLLNFFQFDSTLTVLGSDASATTYENSCPSDNAGISAVPTDLLSDSPTLTSNDFTLPTTDFTEIRPFDTPAPRARQRRQADASGDDYSFCEPYTIIQGPQTYEMHLTDPTPGAWTLDMSCNWEGEMTTADLTCIATQSGVLPDQSTQSSDSTVLAQSDVQSLEAYQTVAVVGATGSFSGASQTPAGSSESGSASGSASGSGTTSPTKSASGSGTALPTKSASGSGTAASQSTALAPAGPLQTGAILGGVVGLVAAVWAW